MNFKNDIQMLLDQHSRWLRDKTVLRALSDQWIEITTPYLDRHNDCLQIYLKPEGDGYLLSDDGYIIGDLASSGCNLDSPKRKELLKTTLAGFGVALEGNQLTIRASEENFALRKHNLIQAMLAVNDLFYLATPHVASLFLEQVSEWMDSAHIRSVPNVKFTGKSGYDHKFDFVIPKSDQRPERLIEVVNHPRKDAVESLIFKWIDTRETRPASSELFAFLNDKNASSLQYVLDALRGYDLKPVLWNERAKYQESLVA
jgi:hypothetical protein